MLASRIYDNFGKNDAHNQKDDKKAPTFLEIRRADTLEKVMEPINL